jgi:hypothetical protein
MTTSTKRRKRKPQPMTPAQLESLNQALHFGSIISNVCWSLGHGQQITTPPERLIELQRQWDHYSAVLNRYRKDNAP